MILAAPDSYLTSFLEALASRNIWLMAAYALCSSLIMMSEMRASTAEAAVSSSRRLFQFALLSLGFFILARAPTLFFNAPLNPDEAEMLANAQKFSLDMNTWRSVDTCSGGPLDSFVLMWPYLIGQTPSFLTARVTALVLLFSAWLTVLNLPGKTASGPRIAILTCMMLVLGGTRSIDYLHYSSEVLPLSLLIFATALILGLLNRPMDLRTAVAAAFLLGTIPFTKLQATPPALFMGLALVWVVLRSGVQWGAAVRPLIVVFTAALTPTILILGSLAITGDFHHFWNSYIGFALGYLDDGVGKAGKASFTMVRFGMAQGPLILTYFEVMAGIITIGLAVNGPALRKAISPDLIIGSGFLASSLFAVVAPGRLFPHYGYLLVMPFAVLAVLAWGPVPGSRDSSAKWSPRSWLALVSAWLILFFSQGGANGPRPGGDRTIFSPSVAAPEHVFGSGDLMSDAPLSDRRMLIWGWMAEWYAYSAVLPATRDVITYNQIWQGPLHAYYRDRMISDLRQSRPRFIVDAVAPGSFYLNNAASDGLSSFPALKTYVDSRYMPISHSPHGQACPRTFLRKDAVSEFKGRYASVSAIKSTSTKVAKGTSFSPDHLLDGVLFETCPDRWLLSDGQLGAVSLDLTTPQPLVSVEILNTRNGEKMDRASGQITLTGWRGTSQMWVRRVDLKRHPYWTRIPVAPEAGAVDRVTIAVDSFTGVGGGLNEVRLVRKAYLQ